MIVGVDPGIVHTGCVRLIIEPENRRVLKEHHLVHGLNATDVAAWALRFDVDPVMTVIERYVPRQKLNTDPEMVQAEARFVRELPNPVVLANTGVRQMVPLNVLALLGLDKFTTRSNHMDLLSAARMAVRGMVREPDTNKLLAAAVEAYLDKDPFEVVDIGDFDELP